MANNKNKSAFNQMKFEVAKELGIDLKEGYNGDKTARENGAIGGRITQKVFEQYTGKNYKNQ
ncbi:MAG TPA: alpha/beta-type small acid-soluble spore protein [Clostridia bacterium]|jgi:hypothetical protein|nr:alpha/beta-type small acid-soluble spore protein [Clostridiaceae bacterium]HOA30598.1 alpha/beta-type small acid-soluble spore protein [Clostridia bacterium]HPZ51463.1 alpha/beta-type small acid-soluble spore protein [Clostridia bacterium]